MLYVHSNSKVILNAPGSHFLSDASNLVIEVVIDDLSGFESIQDVGECCF
jgi:hypothetical protein